MLWVLPIRNLRISNSHYTICVPSIIIIIIIIAKLEPVIKFAVVVSEKSINWNKFLSMMPLRGR